LESIGEYAFYKCASIRSIVLPNSVKQVGRYAFKGCSSIDSLILKNDLKEIGAHAFYGLKAATIYVESDKDLAEWNKYWNSMRRPVVYGCTLSSDKSYVVSVTITETTFFENKRATFGAPERKGYRFVGWATEENGEKVYDAEQVNTAPVGTTLYALWSDSLD
jgi:uncharacterized repeat protein (TIGR02543 family)